MKEKGWEKLTYVIVSFCFTHKPKFLWNVLSTYATTYLKVEVRQDLICHLKELKEDSYLSLIDCQQIITHMYRKNTRENSVRGR